MGNENVVWLRREDDEDGGYEVTDRVDCTGCSVQVDPDASESYDTGQQVRQRVRVFAPADSPLARARARDAVEIAGWHLGHDTPTVIGLLGTPSVLADRLTGRPHHIELLAVWIAG